MPLSSQTKLWPLLGNTLTANKASGEDVGLPDGQMGNSEVGHLNIGAGRIVYQSLTRINISIREGQFYEIPELVEAVKAAKNLVNLFTWWA